MDNPKNKLKKALRKSMKFMLSLNAESSDRIPEWYDQMISELSLMKSDNKFYERAIAKLRKSLKQEYGNNAANFLLA